MVTRNEPALVNDNGHVDVDVLPARAGCYAIIFLSTTDRTDAVAKLRILADNGSSDVSIDPYTDNAGVQYYRVRSGCFRSDTEAEQSLASRSKAVKTMNLTYRPIIKFYAQ